MNLTNIKQTSNVFYNQAFYLSVSLSAVALLSPTFLRQPYSYQVNRSKETTSLKSRSQVLKTWHSVLLLLQHWSLFFQIDLVHHVDTMRLQDSSESTKVREIFNACNNEILGIKDLQEPSKINTCKHFHLQHILDHVWVDPCE